MKKSLNEQIDNSTWKKFRKKAEDLQKTLETLREISDEEKENIFKERAVKLSLAKIKIEDDKDLINIISFYIGGEFYGIDVEFLQEIYEVNNITRIPHTPTVLAGLINHRGSVLTIIDLKVLFNLKDDKVSKKNELENAREQSKENSHNKILILDYLESKVGINIDRFESLLELPRNKINPVPLFFQEKNKIVKSETQVNGHPLLIIDVEALLKDKRLFVDEEV